MISKEKIAQKLKLRMAELGVNPVRVAEKADVKPSFIYDIISGKSANPSVLKLARVARELNVDISYFLKDLDPDIIHEKIVQTANNNLPEDYVKISSLIIEVSAVGGTVATIEVDGEPYSFRSNWIKEKLGVKPSDLRIIWVRGDSMEPTLCNRDVILVDVTRKHPSPPGIFILFDGMGLVAKRLEFVSNSNPPSMIIKSDNPHYSSYNRAMSEINVIGRVVWFSREM